MVWSGLDSQGCEGFSHSHHWRGCVPSSCSLKHLWQEGRAFKTTRRCFRVWNCRMPTRFCVSQFKRKPSAWLMEVRRECARSVDGNNDWDTTPTSHSYPLCQCLESPTHFVTKTGRNSHQAGTNYRLPQRKTFLSGSRVYDYLGRLNVTKEMAWKREN